MCFLDLSGFTRLTEERGDEAAAEMAATLGKLVQRGSQGRGGRPVKWLGDGVMVFFRDAGQVLVSDDVLQVTTDPDVAFVEIGPVELKVVSRPVRLHEARRHSSHRRLDTLVGATGSRGRLRIRRHGRATGRSIA